jgi:hypothetical protein
MTELPVAPEFARFFCLQRGVSTRFADIYYECTPDILDPAMVGKFYCYDMEWLLPCPFE